jgi:hypothetical protein
VFGFYFPLVSFRINTVFGLSQIRILFDCARFNAEKLRIPNHDVRMLIVNLLSQYNTENIDDGFNALKAATKNLCIGNVGEFASYYDTKVNLVIYLFKLLTILQVYKILDPEHDSKGANEISFKMAIVPCI